MANLIQDLYLRHRANPEKMAAASDEAEIYFAGQFVFARVDGHVTGAPAIGDVFLGIATRRQFVEEADDVEYWASGLFLIPFQGAEGSDIGQAIVIPAAALSNNPQDSVPAADLRALSVTGMVEDYSMLVGTCMGVEDSGGWVALHQVPGVMASGIWV